MHYILISLLFYLYNLVLVCYYFFLKIAPRLHDVDVSTNSQPKKKMWTLFNVPYLRTNVSYNCQTAKLPALIPALMPGSW